MRLFTNKETAAIALLICSMLIAIVIGAIKHDYNSYILMAYEMVLILLFYGFSAEAVP